MAPLSDDDLDVLRLLSEFNPRTPPPLVLGVLRELQARRLARVNHNGWHITSQGASVLAQLNH